MVGRLPLEPLLATCTAVAVQPVGVPTCGVGADFEIAAWAFAPCVMIAPPLISFGVAPEHVAVEAVDSAPFAELPANVPAVPDVTTVSVPTVPVGPVAPVGPVLRDRRAALALRMPAGVAFGSVPWERFW